MTRIEQMRALLLAVRLPTLLAGIGPVILGATIGINRVDSVDLSHKLLFLGALGVAIFLQAGANLINDVKDAESGVDNDERLGSLRVVQSGLLSPRIVTRAWQFCFAIASVLFVFIASEAGYETYLLGFTCMLFAWWYTSSSISLSHLGLGELTAFVFFGPVAVAGSAWLIAGYINTDWIIWGCGTGFIAAAMMSLNNFRDRKTDEKSGKKTLAVRLGDPLSGYVPYLMLFGSNIVLILWVISQRHGDHKSLISVIAIIAIQGLWIRPLIKDDASKLNLALKRTCIYNFIYSAGFAGLLLW